MDRIQIALIVCLLSGNLLATNYYAAVNGATVAPYTNWAMAHSNVIELANYVTTGASLYLSNGTYYLTNQIVTKAGMSIIGESRDATILESVQYTNAGNHRIISLPAGANNVIVRNVTITKGYIKSGWYGGGIGTDTTSLGTNTTVDNCIIIDNRDSTEEGGGVYIKDGTVINSSFVSNICIGTGPLGGGLFLEYGGLVTNCYFSYCFAAVGGALANRDAAYSTRTTVLGCTFSRNSSYYNGPSMYLKNATVDNCLIADDTATQGSGSTFLGASIIRNSKFTRIIIGGAFGNRGGGISAQGTTVVEDCEISYNTSGQGTGGGLSLYENAVARRCYIHHNMSVNVGGGGVGFWYNAASTNRMLEACIVSANRITITSGNGAGPGGVYVYNGGKVHNCTVVGNSGWGGANYPVAGVYCLAGEVWNTVVSLNTNTTGPNSEIFGTNNFRYCNGKDLVNGSSNNVNSFIDVASSANFNLVPNSPAVRSGTPKVLFDFNKRPFAADSPSRGAIEFRWEQDIPRYHSRLMLQNKIGLTKNLYNR